MRVHRDDRRDAYCDVFAGAGLPGDVNVFRLHAGAKTFWHRHQRQIDRFFCAAGRVLVRVWREGIGWTEDLDIGDSMIVVPGWWHGYEALEDSILVMYLDQHYDPADEERATAEELGVPW